MNQYQREYEISIFQSKINLFKYLLQTNKNWSITFLLLWGFYLIFALIINLKAVINKIQMGSLSSLTFNLTTNIIILLMLAVVFIVITALFTYPVIGKSLTEYKMSITFDDSEQRLIVEYNDILEKFKVDSDGVIITNAINYFDIAEIGTIPEYKCIDIHGRFKRINTDSINSNNVRYSGNTNTETIENIVIFLDNNRYTEVLEMLNMLCNATYLKDNIWYQPILDKIQKK